jgi:hypothetical protein
MGRAAEEGEMRPPLRYRAAVVICKVLNICVKMPHFGVVFSQCEKTVSSNLIQSKADKIFSRIFCTVSHFSISGMIG